MVLFCCWLLLPCRLGGATPFPLVNVRAITLPAEVLLTWDEWPGAVSYGVYRANLDRRWAPIAKNVLAPRYRDSDFQTLPCYYQVAAYDTTGAVVAFAEISTPNGLPIAPLWPPRVTTRPVSDTSFAVSWNLAAPGDGLLEVGTSPTNYQWAAVNTNFALRQEFVVTNLQPVTTYFYRATSSKAVGTALTWRDTFTTRPFVETPAYIPIPTPDGLPWEVTIDEDVPVRMIFTPSNPSGGEVSYSLLSRPVNGSSLMGSLPDILFVPKPLSTSGDIFAVSATDGVTTHATSVDVHFRPVHHAPIAPDQSVTLNEDTGLKFGLDAISTDADPATFIFVIIDPPTNGTLGRAIYDPLSYVQYIPNTNFNGVDHFIYAVADGQSTGNVATVRIRVLPVPDAPTASPQTVTVLRGAPTNITLAVADVDDDLLQLNIQNGPVHGTVSGNGLVRPLPLEVTYTPRNAPTNNTDSFTYSVFGNNPIRAVATVTINFVPPYYPPVAHGASFNTGLNQPVAVSLSGTAPGGGALSYQVLDQPAHGTLSGTPPTLTYTPLPNFYGIDSFRFSVSDSLAVSAPATNIIYVWGPVPPPAPSGLAAKAVSKSQINLLWSDNAWNEDGFHLERSEDNRHWKQVASTGQNTPSYSNVKLASNKLYYYRVRSFNRFGLSSYSNVASAKTLK